MNLPWSGQGKEKGKAAKGAMGGVFGKSIEELQQNGPLVPLILMECISFLNKESRLRTEGLFRVSPNYRELEELKLLFKDPGEMVLLEERTTNPHNVAGLMKAWFAQLSDPVFSFDIYQPLIDVFRSTVSEPGLINFFQKVIRKIPEDRRCILQLLFEVHHNSCNIDLPFCNV